MTPPGRIEELMEQEHVRLDALLRAADANDAIDEASYDAFRRRLLRHIALEERILLPALKGARGDAVTPLARRLRLDHGAIASVLVRRPTHDICERVRRLLDEHNALEEGRGGMYAQCDDAFDDIDAVVAELRAYPEVPVAKYYDGPLLRPLD